MTTTKERPILMSAPMILALLDGRKTQERRIVKPQPPDCYHKLCGPEHYSPIVVGSDGEERDGPQALGVYSDDGEWGVKCPYAVGMRLWVREAFAIESNRNFMDVYSEPDNPLGPVRWCGQYFECPRYRASEPDTLLVREDDEICQEMRWSPSIHMPRWASRITLEITDIRVQRVQEISHSDALAEGCKPDWDAFNDATIGCEGWEEPEEFEEECEQECDWINYGHELVPSREHAEWERDRVSYATRLAFHNLWDSINGSKYPWDANPWVWAITFKRLEDR